MGKQQQSKQQQSKQQQSKKQQEKKENQKSVLLDLVVRRSSGIEDVYPIDSVDLIALLKDENDFVEYQMKYTPGIRFVIFRRHDGK